MATSATRRAGARRQPDALLADMRPEEIAAMLSVAADLTLYLDADGAVTHADLDAERLGLVAADQWRGRPWRELVKPDSQAKADALLHEAASATETSWGATARWREINHIDAAGGSAPFQMSGLRLASGDAVVFGRDLRPIAELQQRLIDTQQTLERDYAKLRRLETRHRLLFQVTGEAFLLADASTERLLEANPAATRAFGKTTKALAGRPLIELFEPEGRGALSEAVERARATGKSRSIRLRRASDGVDATVSLALFRKERGAHLLARVLFKEPKGGKGDEEAAGQDVALRALMSAPEAFVTLDDSGQVLYANTSFLDLAQLASEEQAVGQSLHNWLGRTGVDLDILLASLRDGGSVRRHHTALRGALGSVEEVEVSAAPVETGDPPAFGMVIRAAGPTPPPSTEADPPVTPHSASQLRDLVGRVPLKELVRETTDTIERLCIETALELTGDNRASAADMLGLSRQSLYVKMRRYGLGDLDSDSDA